jgi:hypothetical protein
LRLLSQPLRVPGGTVEYGCGLEWLEFAVRSRFGGFRQQGPYLLSAHRAKRPHRFAGMQARFYQPIVPLPQAFLPLPDLLLLCRINGVFIRQFHGLSAADKLTLAGMKDLNDIAIDFTFINLMFLSHTTSFWFV